MRPLDRFPVRHHADGLFHVERSAIVPRKTLAIWRRFRTDTFRPPLDRPG